MKRIAILIFVLSFIACNQDGKIYKEYYPSGELRLIQELITEGSYCETQYFENGNKKFFACLERDKIIGETKEYYESSELYATGIYLNGMKNGIKRFYYKDQSLKAINLFENDSLYYIQSIAYESKDTADNIIPIVNFYPLERRTGDTMDIEVRIPFTEDFPYIRSDIVIHYDIEILEVGVGYPLPRKKNITLNKNQSMVMIPFVPNETGVYTIQGLMTIDDEPLKNYDQHFFQREFEVK